MKFSTFPFRLIYSLLMHSHSSVVVNLSVNTVFLYHELCECVLFIPVVIFNVFFRDLLAVSMDLFNQLVSRFTVLCF